MEIGDGVLAVAGICDWDVCIKLDDQPATVIRMESSRLQLVSNAFLPAEQIKFSR